ncbi:hypothetical protein OH491_24355 [Termitidicoccus mucosus]|uniref:Uncharacterized protein n=1 Tax=Termitidicoccus mucosus TaxID=1184151 RepID=A0A178IPA2_9BACT|nr:hypothetical protein AW736_02095 [Opitutaceae bacterium TSB47]
MKTKIITVKNKQKRSSVSKPKRPTIGDKAYAGIPLYKLGDIPDRLYTENPALARACVIKRGLVAAYEEGGTHAEQTITDALVDLRLLCDILNLDFFKIHDKACQYYAKEAGEIRKIRQKKTPPVIMERR